MHSNFPSIWGESKNRKYLHAMGPEGGCWGGGRVAKKIVQARSHIFVPMLTNLRPSPAV